MQARLERKLVQRGREVENEAAPRSGDQQHELGRKRLREALANALATLPERQRAALLLVHYEGLSYQEAAESIDVTEAALESLIHRARSAMMLQLAPFVGHGAEVEHAV